MPVLLAITCLAISPLFPGRNVDTSQRTVRPGVFAKPSTVSMTRDGDIVAFLPSATADDAIGVVSGSVRRIVPLPSNKTMAASFGKPEMTPSGVKVFPHARVVSIAAQNAAPIITISNPFSGAYSGTETASFMWMRGAWHAIQLGDVAAYNSWIVGASPTSEAYGVDMSAHLPGMEQNASPADDVGAFFKAGGAQKLMRAVVPTEANQRSFLGYRVTFRLSYQTPRPVDPFQTTKPEAFVYSGGRTQRLFEGIAWASDGGGTYVGDNRHMLAQAGFPIVYRAGAKHVISTKHGTAFSVNRDGLVVGSVQGTDGEDHAFAYDLSRKPSAMVMLDSLLLDRRARVAEAYDIVDDGTILALVSRNGAIEVVRLTPSPLMACKK